MALSPDEIEGREFGLSRRGYDRDEVDDFLLEVADTIRQTEAAAAATDARSADVDQADDTATDDHGDPVRARLSAGPADTDDFGRLGAEVASVLRTADEAAARRRAEADAEATRLRDEADGYAHRLREETEAETARIRAEADVEARNARTALEEATEQARVMIQEAKDEAQRVSEEAERAAGIRREELLESAERQAAQAADVERDVHGRLVAVRGDLDRAVGRLDPAGTAAAGTITNEQASALDPADTPVDTDGGTPADDPERLLGQGPPTPAVPPPGTAEASEDVAEDGEDDTDGNAEDAAGADDLPYADEDEPLDESGSEDDTEAGDLPYAEDDGPLEESSPDGPDLDLSDRRRRSDSTSTADDLPYAEDDDDEIPPPPPPPPPPPGYESSPGAAADDDLPYAADDDEIDDAADSGDGPSGEKADVIDLREGARGDAEAEGDDSGDPLAAMVRDAVGKAVQGAMRRRPGSDT